MNSLSNSVSAENDRRGTTVVPGPQTTGYRYAPATLPGRMTRVHVYAIQAATALLLFLSSGCETSQQGTVVPDEFFETLVFEPLGHGFMASVPDTTEVLLRDSVAWSEFSEKLLPIGRFKDVDFDQMMVVVAVVPATSGGYTIEFESVDVMADELVATYTLTSPGLDCMTIAALTQPFQAIAVRKADGPIRFVRHTIRENCGT